MILQSLYPSVIISQQTHRRPYKALPHPRWVRYTQSACAAVLGAIERRYDLPSAYAVRAQYGHAHYLKLQRAELDKTLALC